MRQAMSAAPPQSALTDDYAALAELAGGVIHDIKTYLPADLLTLHLNKELLRQALLNLMLNAVQAMPEGGELTFQASAENSHVVLSLIDTGAGIAAEVLPKIFKPFYSTKSKSGG